MRSASWTSATSPPRCCRSHQSWPSWSNQAAVRLARDINEELADIVRARSDGLGAFASIPLDTPDDALKEIAYALDGLGLDGVVLPSDARGAYFGEPFFEPILAELARRRTPVFVHPESCPHIDVLGMGRVRSIVEFPLDTARTIVNAVYRGVFQRHPGLTLILAHASGALPTLGGRLAARSQTGRAPQDAAIDAGHVSEALRSLFYETALAGSRNSLLPTLEVSDTDHVLFGTDWPAAPVRSSTTTSRRALRQSRRAAGPRPGCRPSCRRLCHGPPHRRLAGAAPGVRERAPAYLHRPTSPNPVSSVPSATTSKTPPLPEPGADSTRLTGATFDGATSTDPRSPAAWSASAALRSPSERSTSATRRTPAA